MRKLAVIVLSLLLVRCSQKEEQPMFSAIESAHSGIQFENTVSETMGLNLLTNEYTYMGGGVGVGDFNNDGLQDLFFSASQASGKLYINEGDFRFRDITEKSGVVTSVWCTGVSVIDINNDGWQDLYLSVSGSVNPEKRRNLLFINNHDLTFTEQAAACGLDDDSYATQAVFLDYDKDGLLDMYLLTHQMYGAQVNRVVPPDLSGNSPRNDRLYHNDGSATEGGMPHFSDVTLSAGIREDGYGLGVVVSDLNNDNWPDIYVGNDYIGNDCLWLNQQDGTFRNVIGAAVNHQSYSSMGTDAADINNDGLPDVLTLDMMPEDNERKKMMYSILTNERHQMELNLGYQPSYMRNMLQLNQGTVKEGNTTIPMFAEIGNYAGVAETDWSWSVLAADFDCDGYRDLHITNGLGRDLLNSDFASFSAGKSGGGPNPVLINALQEYGTVPLSNYLLRNRHNSAFENIAAAAGVAEKAISNGAAYADLDNDGDLDLVVNNINSKVFLFANNTITKESKAASFLSFTLHGPPQNPDGIGTRVKLFIKDSVQLLESNPVRGYLSTVDRRLYTGLGAAKIVDSIQVVWPNARMEMRYRVSANSFLQIDYRHATANWQAAAPEPTLFADLTRQSGVAFKHVDSFFFDYAFQRLLPQKYSALGPGVAVADVNGDGLQDFFVGNGFQKTAMLFLQNGGGSFAGKPLETGTKQEEDAGSLFFDADGDGDADLLVTGGTNEFPKNSTYHLPRLYRNNGKGQFARAPEAIPGHLTGITAVVKAADYDGDGDLDLFLGGRITAGSYPTPPPSYLLQNNGGVFTDITQRVCPELGSAGMITDAVFSDIDGDKRPELLLAGEWMPIRVFKFHNSKLEENKSSGLGDLAGMWRSVTATDIDDDGDVDLVAGNIGWNNKYHFDSTHPLNLWYADYDGNGSVDPVMAYYQLSGSGSSQLFPAMGLGELAGQLPMVRKQYLLHKDFAVATMPEIFSSYQPVGKLTAGEAASCWFENRGGGRFRKHQLPYMAQLAPVNCILADDFNGDGIRDLLLAGNEYQSEVGTGRYDAGYGLLLLGQKNKTFYAVPQQRSGLYLRGDVRCLQPIKVGRQTQVLAAVNNDLLRVYGVPANTPGTSK